MVDGKKPGSGRRGPPAMPPEELTHPFSVRLKDSEREALERAAEKDAGHPTCGSVWAREVLLEAVRKALGEEAPERAAKNR